MSNITKCVLLGQPLNSLVIFLTQDGHVGGHTTLCLSAPAHLCIDGKARMERLTHLVAPGDGLMEEAIRI